MNKDITLVILAAGMGSRFGGLKQITPFGPNNEFIIDYSVYDAIKAGFTKIVFLIKEENYKIFKETIGKRVEPHIKVEYCFQKNDNIPSGYNLPKDRVKPLGTAHALLCCKEKVHEPFMIINADDFYGRDAYIKAASFLKNCSTEDNKYGMIGYLVKNTLTEIGAVKRGICTVEGSSLIKLEESSVEKMKDGKIIAKPLCGDPSFEVSLNDIVSMNMLLFNPTIFTYIEENFKDFFEENKENLDTAEYLIPILLFKLIKQEKVNTTVIKTTSSWYGVTYPEDAEGVRAALKEMVNNGKYPNNLWKED